ncbi:MAG: hypothetical protein AB7O97_06785 [Planctomycetota bacterium]
MSSNRVRLLSLLSLAVPAAAQGLLFSTSQTERTLSGSGGTVLRDLHANEVALQEFTPCPSLGAEKWGARTTFQTMAGDADGNGTYWDPQLFGNLDALVHLYLPGQALSPRTIFWSPSQQLGTARSGAPGLRPGDTGRIVGVGSSYGQVEYFLSADQVQSVLGMPATPVTVDVDAIAADGGFGIFFSLDQDTPVNTTCGATFVRDGDLLMIPPSMITWTPDLRVAAVVPGCAIVVYDEAAMDGFVQNAQVTDAAGNCVSVIQDLEALDLDFTGRQFPLTVCSGTFWIPSLRFTGELLSGASVLTTDLAGSIEVTTCGALGRSCGSGPTLGDQMGLLPPISGTGVPSHVDALDDPFGTERFLIEPQQHVIGTGAPAVLDVHSPLPWTVIAVEVVPTTVAPHIGLPPFAIFRDLYILGSPPWTDFWIGPGFTTRATPAVPVPCKLVFQAGGIVLGNVVLSAPATVDVQ